MSISKKGLRIGAYRIKPLGLCALAVILLIIVACVIFFGGKPFAEGGDGFLSPTATPTLEPTPTPTPTPVPTPTPTPRVATIRSLGEIAIQNNLLKAAKLEDGSFDFSDMFSEISSLMGDADYTIADVEGSLGGTKKASGSTGMITPPSLIQTLADCGVDMLNLANDHALDGGFEDLQAAIENCKAAGMEYVGASASQEERNTAKVVEINGIKVGFVAYTESLNVKDSEAGKDALKYGIHLVAKSNARKDVQACRDAGAEVVIACVSWGKMLGRDVTKSQKNIAEVLVQCGVDVIIGYNPHVIQQAIWMEMTKGGSVSQRTLCIYSNGNFLSDVREQYGDSGVIFEFTLQEREDRTGFDIVSPKYIPTYVWRIEEDENSYDYRTLAVGQWLDATPEGMNYAQESRMRAVWAEAQSVMGSDVAEIANE